MVCLECRARNLALHPPLECSEGPVWQTATQHFEARLSDRNGPFRVMCYATRGRR